MRATNLYIQDILESINKIESFIYGYSFDDFYDDIKTTDAVVRNLEIIGEAAKKLPKSVLLKTSSINWAAIKGMRNIIAHEYFGIDLQIIWKTLNEELPVLKKEMLRFV